MKFFYKDLTVDVPSNVYYPREDSTLFADFLCKYLKNQKFKNQKSILEIGCGSGFLSILVARLTGAKIVAADISKEAVACAKQNAKNNSVDIIVKQSDLFGNIKGKFDLIIFNAPYLNEQDELVEENIRRTWTGGLKLIEKFIKNSKNFLTKNGEILLLASSATGDVLKLFQTNCFKADIVERKKIAWEELLIIKANISIEKKV